MKPFQPGQSGNPAGRPKYTTVLSKAIKEVLGEEIIVTTEDGEGKRRKVIMSRAQKIARAVAAKAEMGSVAAADFMAERSDGKVKDVFEMRGRRDEMERLAQTDPGELATQLEGILGKLKRFGVQRSGPRGDGRKVPRGGAAS